MNSTSYPHQAGFWRRSFAFLIDLLLVAALFNLLGVVLFASTEGKVRVGTTIPADYASCSDVPERPTGLILPDDFKLTRAGTAYCTMYFFGLVHDRVLVVADVQQSGALTVTRKISFPVDTDGHLVNALYIDYFLLLFLLAYLWLSQWLFGRTLGKRIAGLSVHSLTGGRLTAWQITKRELVRFIPFYLVFGNLLINVLVTPASYFRLDPFPLCIGRYFCWWLSAT
jgi:uncharacterized RDD family membrane protein YckC